MRYARLAVSIVIVLILLFGPSPRPLAGRGPTSVFTATLTTDAELHPVIGSTATGTATFSLNAAGDAIDVTLHVDQLSGPAWGAHVHGPATAAETAGVIVTLCGVPAPAVVADCATIAGALTLTGTITAAHFSDPGMSVESLLALMASGLAYANVHTDMNPSGEVRGQISAQ